MQTSVAIKVIKAEAYKEYHDLIEREIMVSAIRTHNAAARHRLVTSKRMHPCHAFPK